MADHDGLLRKPSDDLLEMIGDLTDRLPRKNLGMRLRLLDGIRVVGVARRHWGVSGVFE